MLSLSGLKEYHENIVIGFMLLSAFVLGCLANYLYHKKYFHTFTSKEIKKFIAGMANGDMVMRDYIYIKNTVYANENKLNLHKQNYYVGHDGTEPQIPFFTNEAERKAYAIDYILSGLRDKGIILNPDEEKLKAIEALKASQNLGENILEKF
ncbi:MAG: hypothetical protein ACLTFB_00895 [Candidatus Phytoplasma pyri]